MEKQNLDFKQLDELYQIKKNDPEKYKEILKGMKEVLTDLFKMMAEVTMELEKMEQ